MSIAAELRETDRRNRQEAAELSHFQAELARVRKELDAAMEVTSLLDRFNPANLLIPDWIKRTKRAATGRYRATATLQLSDTHFDEVIKDSQILGYNRYDARIAEMRLRTLGEKTIEVAHDFIGGVDYDGLVILATGDVFSGDIHEELKNTNERPLLEGMVYWVPRTISFLQMLANDFGKVHVAAVVGNHGRNTHRPIYKNRAQNNIEWAYWHYVADVLAAQGETRITFDIADGLSMNTQIYDTSYALEHGDEFKGGSGISGAKAPLMLGQHRVAVQRIAMGLPITWMVVGHFHQYQPPSQGLIMGGSLKGYDEYAAGKKFRPEIPIQGFWVTTPERGPTVFAPIQPMVRKKEGW